jgi:2,4-dienoyl-CoA reductase-like NADH-dependent reductase (Old Yellow Enzyme family)
VSYYFQAHLFGFDGIQLHAAYVNLLAQFLSGTENKRKDRYGGSCANRFRIVEEIYNEIRFVFLELKTYGKIIFIERYFRRHLAL